MSSKTQRLLILLQERFPAAFPADHKYIRPLRIGIDQDLKATLGDEVDAKSISRVIGHHTHRLSYLRALSRGGQRIDLHGNAVEEVTHKARQLAIEKLKAMGKWKNPQTGKQ
jgi:sRNA-binding protein